MDKNTLITLNDFEKDILWPKRRHGGVGIPKPSRRTTTVMTEAVNKLFYTADGTRRANVNEREIAHVTVKDVINKAALPSHLRAALSLKGHNAKDRTKPGTGAALYPSEVLPQNGHPDWTHVRLFIEFKPGGTENDPFERKINTPEECVESQQDVREQLLAYASETFQHQHRTALFSLLINGDDFRAMYWDLSGIIVTEATNYVEDPSSLLRFLWAFASLTDEQQGIDPTATLLSRDSEQYKLMDTLALENPALDMPFHEFANISHFPHAGSAVSLSPAAGTRRKTKQPAHPVFQFVREGFRKSLAPGWPRYKLLVGEDNHEFLVAHPIFTSSSLFGRGTRGYIACDLRTNKFVWLKDSWRPIYEGVEPEGNYLQAMASKTGIKLTIPTVVAHGDVLGQTTSVEQYRMAKRSQSAMLSAEVPSDHDAQCGKKRAREETPEDAEFSELEEPRCAHYRIAVEEVCLKMGNFPSGKRLVQLVLDCIKTHSKAYTHFNLLHRDVSTGNMLILPWIEKGPTGMRRVRWRGLLTDWEVAKYVSKDNSLQYAKKSEWTGTWQFMSVDHVRHPERPVVVADELESFFHALLHHAVRYLRHTHHGMVKSFMSDYFDTIQELGPNAMRCSYTKTIAVTKGDISVDMLPLKFAREGDLQHPLNDLLEQWLVLFTARYHILRKQREKRHASKASIASLPVLKKASGRRFPSGEFPESAPRHPLLEFDSPDEAAAKAAAEEAEKEETAALLDEYSETFAIFQECLDEPRWPRNDVVGDQLCGTKNPKKRPAARKPVVAPINAGRKASDSKSSKRAKHAHDVTVTEGSGSAS